MVASFPWIYTPNSNSWSLLMTLNIYTMIYTFFFFEIWYIWIFWMLKHMWGYKCITSDSLEWWNESLEDIHKPHYRDKNSHNAAPQSIILFIPFLWLAISRGSSLPRERAGQTPIGRRSSVRGRTCTLAILVICFLVCAIGYFAPRVPELEEDGLQEAVPDEEKNGHYDAGDANHRCGCCGVLPIIIIIMKRKRALVTSHN